MADFDDGRAREHAEEMATPWFGINEDSYTPIWTELQTWPEDELIEECQQLQVPVLILDGGRDLRPRWAVDSLERALPRVTRVTIPEADHGVPGQKDAGRVTGVPAVSRAQRRPDR
jgi:proline iminopeptidase